MPPSFMPEEHCASTNMNTISSVAKGTMMSVFIALYLQLGWGPKHGVPLDSIASGDPLDLASRA
jgi:hypothetical protein